MTFAIQINVTAATTVISRVFFPVNKHKNRLYVYTTLILSQYACLFLFAYISETILGYNDFISLYENADICELFTVI